MGEITGLLVFLSTVVCVLGTKTYYMDQRCGGVIDMSLEGIQAGRLELTAAPSYSNRMQCVMKIKAPIGKFLMFNNPYLNTESNNDKLYIYDSSTVLGTYLATATLSGSSEHYSDILTTQRYATLKFVSDHSVTMRGFTLIFTAFTSDLGYCSGYSCMNYGGTNECIDSSLTCDGTRNCDATSDDDESLCNDGYNNDFGGITTAAIIGASVGSLVFISFVIIIIRVICGTRRTVVSRPQRFGIAVQAMQPTVSHIPVAEPQPYSQPPQPYSQPPQPYNQPPQPYSQPPQPYNQPPPAYATLPQQMTTQGQTNPVMSQSELCTK